jgi:hypothetical protein
VPQPAEVASQAIPENKSWSNGDGGRQQRAAQSDAAWRLPLGRSAVGRAGLLSVAPGLSNDTNSQMEAMPLAQPLGARAATEALAARASQGHPLQRTVIGYPDAFGNVRSASSPSALPATCKEPASPSEIMPAPAHESNADRTTEVLPTPFAAAAVQGSTPTPQPVVPVAADRPSMSPAGPLVASSVEPAVTMAVIALGLRVVKGHLESAGVGSEGAFCPASLNTYTWPAQRWEVNHR